MMMYDHMTIIYVCKSDLCDCARLYSMYCTVYAGAVLLGTEKCLYMSVVFGYVCPRCHMVLCPSYPYSIVSRGLHTSAFLKDYRQSKLLRLVSMYVHKVW